MDQNTVATELNPLDVVLHLFLISLVAWFWIVA